MSVTFIRSELTAMFTIYNIIRDCLEGEPAIKGWILSGMNISQNAAAFNGGGANPFLSDAVLFRAQRYLPMPNVTDQSIQNKDRYRQYLQRAVWYNVASRTLDGMIGQIFLIPPVIKLPKGLEPMLEDCDSEGLSFVQNSKRSVRYNMAYGRMGLYVDYPKTEGSVTQEQITSGQIKPMIQVIAPWNIVNWRTKKIDGKNLLTLVVIIEKKDSYDNDGYSVYQAENYRVLKLDDVTGNYTVEIHEAVDLKGGKSKTQFQKVGDSVTPVDSNGNPFKFIPFTFIGAENNDSAVDKPPMYDLCSLNLGHYRNSADYEESVHMVGQPTPWASGLDQSWVDTVLKGTIPLGSSAGIPLPTGASIGLLEANPNNLASEAMKLKEDEMIALGAKLVIQKRTQKTATQTKQDVSSETSILTNVADNVSSAYLWAFKVACQFTGDNPNDIKVALNTEFELNSLSADDISKVVAIWQLGCLAWEEIRETLRKAGYANLPNDQAKAAIKQERKDGLIPELGAAKVPTGAPNPNSDPAGHAGTAANAAAGQ